MIIKQFSLFVSRWPVSCSFFVLFLFSTFCRTKSNKNARHAERAVKVYFVQELPLWQLPSVVPFLSFTLIRLIFGAKQLLQLATLCKSV